MKKKTVFILFLIVIGFAYRLLLSFRPDTSVTGDEFKYQSMAQSILSGKLAADSSKNAGYSVFLAGVYFIFGYDNLKALSIIQIILDLITAFLLYLTARNIFSEKAAIFVLIIYITNPLTSSFTGLRMSEIVNFFIIAGIAYIISGKLFTSRGSLWLIYGILSGILVFLRFQFKLFVFATLITPLFNFKPNARIKYLIVAFVGFMIASLYSLISFYAMFKVVSVGPPILQSWGSMYAHLFVNSREAELNFQTPIWRNDPGYADVFSEYAALDQKYWNQLEQKNKMRFFHSITTLWPIFISHMARNSVWLWDKYHLSEYYDIYYPADSIFIRVYNILILLLFVLGLIAYILRNKITAFLNPVFVYSLCLFLYITILFSMVDNESRHTLPFYPLMMLWAGWGFTYFLNKWKSLFRKS
jgi:hypothetical protein